MMDSLQARELPGTQGVNQDVAWSPDSQYVAFLAQGNVRRSTLAEELRKRWRRMPLPHPEFPGAVKT